MNEAGRELDARIEADVFKREVINTGHGPASLRYDGFDPIPYYSTGIAAAWMVVDAMRLHGLTLELNCYFRDENYDSAIWAAMFGIQKDLQEAPTAPLAVCLAALKAVGGS